MLEVFCDNFIHMSQTSDPAKLIHLSIALLHGIRSVFQLPHVSGNNGQDLISKKKLDSGKVQRAVRKEVLGWMVDGKTRFIELAWDKQSMIDADLHEIVRMIKWVPLKLIDKSIIKV